MHARRSPYGERGLKFNWVPCWAWEACRRSPYGERGLKFGSLEDGDGEFRRSPYGERGLKYHRQAFSMHRMESLSLRRAWIEICGRDAIPHQRQVALLTESVD